MKVAKQTLIVFWIITLISLAGLAYLHSEIHVSVAEMITQKDLVCVEDECDFYQGMWSNIFTGAIVSVMTTYVAYARAKHDVEFNLKMSEQMLTIDFGLLSSSMYSLNLKHPQNNHAAVCRFSNQISEIHKQYDRMIAAQNDYSPFFKTKKVKTFMDAKRFLQDMWVDICPVEDDLLTYESEASLKEAIDKTRAKVQAKKDQLQRVHDDVWKY